MANTHEAVGNLGNRPGRLHKSYETSGANAAVTVSTPTTLNRVRRLIAVLVSYSGSVTKNATVTYNAAHGADYDNLLHTIAISTALDGKWIPDEAVLIAAGDAIDVVTDAGGVGVTCAVTVITEEF